MSGEITVAYRMAFLITDRNRFLSSALRYRHQAGLVYKSCGTTCRTSIWRSRWGGPGGILLSPLASENHSPWAILCFYLHDPTLSRFSRKPTSDRQTQGYSIYRASIASGGKNCKTYTGSCMLFFARLCYCIFVLRPTSCKNARALFSEDVSLFRFISNGGNLFIMPRHGGIKR